MTDLDKARAYLDTDKWHDSLTDEQRTNLSKRRQILGSLEDTYALNRYEQAGGAA